MMVGCGGRECATGHAFRIEPIKTFAIAGTPHAKVLPLTNKRQNSGALGDSYIWVEGLGVPRNQPQKTERAEN
jgi:hypothetical protein